MDGRTALEQITRGLQAAGKIRRMIEATPANDRDSSVRPDRLSMIYGTLEAIVQYFPASSKDPFAEALNRSGRYCKTYHDIKHHFRSLGSREKENRDIIETLRVISPVLPTPQKAAAKKVTQILEILKS